MHWLVRDLRFAIRENIRRPGFTGLAVLTLALGIGAVTTMYSVIQNVLLNPFPYTDPRSMVDVLIQDTSRTRGGLVERRQRRSGRAEPGRASQFPGRLRSCSIAGPAHGRRRSDAELRDNDAHRSRIQSAQSYQH